MPFLKIYSIFLLFALANFTKFPNCSVSYSFAKVCYFYKYNEICTPWNTTSCEKLKTIRNEFKCPKYKCAATTVTTGQKSRPLPAQTTNGRQTKPELTTRHTTLRPTTTKHPKTTYRPPKTTTRTSRQTTTKHQKTTYRSQTTTKHPKTTKQRTTVKQIQTRQITSTKRPRTYRPPPTTTTKRTTPRPRSRFTSTAKLSTSKRLPTTSKRWLTSGTSTKPTTVIPVRKRWPIPAWHPQIARVTTAKSIGATTTPSSAIRTTVTQKSTTKMTSRSTFGRTSMKRPQFSDIQNPTTMRSTSSIHPVKESRIRNDVLSKNRDPEQQSESSVFSKVFREKRSDIDCGSKICYLTHEVRENCYLYIHKNNTDCEIPCKLENCAKELHHFITCPVWHCHDISTTTADPKTTTTTTQTTTAMTTTAILTTTFNPSPFTLGPLPPLDHPAYLYTSFAANILLVLVICGMLIAKCKKSLVRRFRNRQRRRQQTTSDVERSTNPIVRLRHESSTANLRRNASTARYFSMDTSSSEDFDTNKHEHIPLLTQTIPSPRIPSFLNSPVLPIRSRDSVVSPISSTDNFQSRLRSTFDQNIARPSSFNPNPRIPRRRSTSSVIETSV